MLGLKIAGNHHLSEVLYFDVYHNVSGEVLTSNTTFLYLDFSFFFFFICWVKSSSWRSFRLSFSLLLFSSLLFRTKWLQCSSVTTVTGECWVLDLTMMIFNFPNNISWKIWHNRKICPWTWLKLGQIIAVCCKMCVMSTSLNLLSSAATTQMFCNCAFNLFFLSNSKLEPKFYNQPM